MNEQGPDWGNNCVLRLYPLIISLCIDMSIISLLTIYYIGNGEIFMRMEAISREMALCKYILKIYSKNATIELIRRCPYMGIPSRDVSLDEIYIKSPFRKRKEMKMSKTRRKALILWQLKAKIQVSFLNPHAQALAFTKLLSTMSGLEMAYLTDCIASLIAISASNCYYYYIMVRIPALSRYLFPFGTGMHI